MLSGEEGHRFSLDLLLHPQLADLLAQLREPGPLLGAEPGLAVAALRARTLDPHPQSGDRQVEIMSDLRNGLPLVEHQPNRTGFELVGEAPTRSLWLFPSSMIDTVSA